MERLAGNQSKKQAEIPEFPHAIPKQMCAGKR